MAFSILFSKKKDTKKVVITNHNIERNFSYKFFKIVKKPHKTNITTRVK